MGSQTVPNHVRRRAWAIAKRDHDIVTRQELLAAGFHPKAIEHRVQTRRLHPKGRGVYAVGSPNLTKYGRWMVAIKECGPGAVLSLLSAAVLWGLWKHEPGRIRVTVPRARNPKRPGVKVSRRDLPERHVTRQHGIPVTTVLRTLIDLAPILAREEMERLVGQADAMNLLRADALREQLEQETCRGARILKQLLDSDSYVLTHSELERLFAEIAAGAGIGAPTSQKRFGKNRVDFYFDELDLVVECNGLRYHRTQLQQRKDAERAHAHLLEGRSHVAFTHHQVKHEREHVRKVLSAEAARIRAAAPSPA